MAAHVGEPPTVATDETLSQPSTSGGTNEDAGMADADQDNEKEDSTDSDASIGWEDYEHRKDVLVKKLVVCEQMMTRIKVTAKYTRLKDYEKSKEAIKNRSDPEFLSRVAVMEREEQKEREKQETVFNLELAALERANEGEMDFIERGYRDRMMYRKSQLLYDAKLKLNKILERIKKEDDVRADVRIFLGEEVPDEWLDEFVKTYVDEMEEHENNEDAVREKRLKKYRMEACESLDTGESLSALLERAEEGGHWTGRSTLQRLPQSVYKEEERKRMERERRRDNQKNVDEKLKSISHKNIDRFFGGNVSSSRADTVVEDYDVSGEDSIDDLLEEREMEEKERKVQEERGRGRRKRRMTDEEDGERRELEERLEEVKRQYKDEKEMRRGMMEEERRKEEERWRREEEGLREWERREKERQEQMVKERLERRGVIMSEESCSDEEKQDLASTVRQGVKAILVSHGSPALSARCENRLRRLKKTLRTMLKMKQQFSSDHEMKHLRNTMIDLFVAGAKRGRRELFEHSQIDDCKMDDLSLEEHVRDSSLVNGIMAKTIERPMSAVKLVDREGRARGAVERERKRREHLITHYIAMKREHQEKYRRKEEKEKEEEVDERRARGWEEERRRKKKSRRRERKDSNETINGYDEETSNGQTGEMNEMTEEEKAEREKRLREIRAVIEGRDPMDEKEESPLKEVQEDEVVVEEIEEEEEKNMEGRHELNGKMTMKKKKNGQSRKKSLWTTYSSESSDEDEKYGSASRAGYGSVPAYRLAAHQQPRMQLQLSKERIIRDLYRSGALRLRESYGENLEKLDREKRQRLLSSLPSSSSFDASRVNLLSPRSRRAIEEMPEEAMRRLTKKEREALIRGLPSTSHESSEEGEEESEEELSEGWELEEEEEEKEKKKETQPKEEEDEEEEESDYEYEEYQERMQLGSSSESNDEEEITVEEWIKQEEIEEPRSEEMGETERSPPNAARGSPLLHESSIESKQEKAPGMNGFSRTGTTTVS